MDLTEQSIANDQRAIKGAENTPAYQKVPKVETLSDDLTFVRMHPLELHHGVEIKPEIWKSLLGDLEPVLEALLVEAGDELYVKGSSILKLGFGGFVADKKTGKAAESLRADIDVVTTQESVEKRLAAVLEQKNQHTSTHVSKKIKLGTTEVEFVSLEELRLMDSIALQELHRWLYSADAITKIPEAELYFLRSQCLGLMQAINTANPTQFMARHHLFPVESISLRFVRLDDGSLKAHLVDPTNFLEDCEIRGQIYEQEERGTWFGLRTVGPIDKLFTAEPLYANVKHLIVAALEYNPGEALTFSNKIALHAIEAAIPRMIKMACELDIDVYAEGVPTDYFFRSVWQIAEIVSKGEEVFAVGRAMQEELKLKGYDSVNEWFTYKVQEGLARAAASNVEYAMQYALLMLPLAGFIDQELAKYFEDTYKNFPPNTVLIYIIECFHRKFPIINLQHPYIPEIPETPSLLSILQIIDILGKEYKTKIVQMHDLEEETDGQTKPLYRYDYLHNPTSMSEIMGVVLHCVGWYPEKDKAKIERVVKNWRPNGTLEASWKTQLYVFDMGLDVDKITQKMENLANE